MNLKILFFKKLYIFRIKNLATLNLKIYSNLLNQQFLSYKAGFCYPTYNLTNNLGIGQAYGSYYQS